MDRQQNKGRLAVIAGGGQLPLHVANAARRHGENPYIIALKGEASPDWAGFDHRVAGIGDLARITAIFKEQGIDRVVLSGGVLRRPEWRDIRPTLRTLIKLPGVLRTLMTSGDNKVLVMVIGLIESAGCRVVGADEIAPDLVAEAGPLGAVFPNPDDRKDMDAGIRAALQLGAMDIGQGAVAVGGRVIALEAAEGTDSMLARVAELRASGRISSRRKGVLVKMCKPQQDPRADLPTIGVSTVERALAAGLAGIAVEAGRALIIDRADLLERANVAGLFVYGIEPEQRS